MRASSALWRANWRRAVSSMLAHDDVYSYYRYYA